MPERRKCGCEVIYLQFDLFFRRDSVEIGSLAD